MFSSKEEPSGDYKIGKVQNTAPIAVNAITDLGAANKVLCLYDTLGDSGLCEEWNGWT